MTMDQRTRDMLDQIDEFLSKGTSSSNELWTVLSALRGPDADIDKYFKAGTTEPVRTAAFPKTAEAYRVGHIMLGAFFALPGERVSHLGHHSHFNDHVVRAAELLGIYE